MIVRFVFETVYLGVSLSFYKSGDLHLLIVIARQNAFCPRRDRRIEYHKSRGHRIVAIYLEVCVSVLMFGVVSLGRRMERTIVWFTYSEDNVWFMGDTGLVQDRDALKICKWSNGVLCCITGVDYIGTTLGCKWFLDAIQLLRFPLRRKLIGLLMYGRGRAFIFKLTWREI